MSAIATAAAVGPVWFDGELVAAENAKLPVLSIGLHNAICVFDGIRVHESYAFAVTEHVDRLCSSAAAVGMTLPWTAAQIAAAVEATVAASGYSEAYVRPVAWRGAEAVGINTAGTTVHLAIAVIRWPEPQAVERPPLRLTLSEWRRPAPTMGPVQAKTSANYLVGSLALARAHSDGYDDAILLDHRGRVAEATGANIFLVRDGELITPVADSFLDGITRQTVLRLAADAGIRTHIVRVSLEDISAADEVFLTGTASGIAPVGQFSDIEYPRERPVTETLAAAYADLVFAHRTKEGPRIPSV
ncbi:aminotransferase class IV [Nocardia sp. NPDC019395]|uniref:aminotransferase class IV n=1 Tax=Nocardia sp. NPDC019395 TaxID=3154686 RepID=UPI0034033DA5